MDDISREQMERFIEDISFVKTAIQKNVSILQQLDYRPSLRFVALMSAIATFFFSGVFSLLIKNYGSYMLIPITIKTIVFCAIAFLFIVFGIMKNSGILKSARTIDPGYSLGRLIREYFTVRIYHLFLPLGLVVAFCIAYAALSGGAHYIIPILAIGAGLIYNCFGTLLRLDEMLWAGYWFLLTGAIVLIFNTIPVLLSISLTMGCGLVILSVAMYLPQKNRREA